MVSAPAWNFSPWLYRWQFIMISLTGCAPWGTRSSYSHTHTHTHTHIHTLLLTMLSLHWLPFMHAFLSHFLVHSSSSSLKRKKRKKTCSLLVLFHSIDAVFTDEYTYRNKYCIVQWDEIFIVSYGYKVCGINVACTFCVSVFGTTAVLVLSRTCFVFVLCS